MFSSQVRYQGIRFEVEKPELQLSPSGITGKGLSHCAIRPVPGKQSFCKTIPLYLWICVFPFFLEHNSKNVFNDHTLLSQLLKCLYKKKKVCQPLGGFFCLFTQVRAPESWLENVSEHDAQLCHSTLSIWGY